MLVGQKDRVLAEPGRGAVGALSPQRDANVEDALGLGADVEIGRLAGDQEVSNVAPLYQELGSGAPAVLLLLVGDHQ